MDISLLRITVRRNEFYLKILGGTVFKPFLAGDFHVDLGLCCLGGHGSLWDGLIWHKSHKIEEHNDVRLVDSYGRVRSFRCFLAYMTVKATPAATQEEM